MKLNEMNKLRLEQTFLRLDVLRTCMWLNVLYEFDGPLSVWRKELNLITGSEPGKEATIRELLGHLHKYIYGDFNHQKPQPNRPLLLTHLYSIVFIFNIHGLKRYFPIDYRVLSKEHTNKRVYLHDRKAYRSYHNAAQDGSDLKLHYYKEYKHIAKKYQWPIIYNGDDAEV
jgi:hypothetical protein